MWEKSFVRFSTCNPFRNLDAIKNFPVTIKDIDILMKICGTNIPSLKRMSTHCKTPASNKDCIELPPELQANNKTIELSANSFCIQGLFFPLTLSKHIKFHDIGAITNQNITSLCKSFNQTFRIHNAAGFTITHLHVDPNLSHSPITWLTMTWNSFSALHLNTSLTLNAASILLSKIATAQFITHCPTTAFPRSWLRSLPSKQSNSSTCFHPRAEFPNILCNHHTSTPWPQHQLPTSLQLLHSS